MNILAPVITHFLLKTDKKEIDEEKEIDKMCLSELIKSCERIQNEIAEDRLLFESITDDILIEFNKTINKAKLEIADIEYRKKYNENKWFFMRPYYFNNAYNRISTLEKQLTIQKDNLIKLIYLKKMRRN